MSMAEAEEIALLLRSAIPIDDVDQMLAPDLSFAIIWIDISERQISRCWPRKIPWPMAFPSSPFSMPIQGNKICDSGCALCTTFCMDYLPHDRLVHPTSYSSKQVALESKEASETIKWEQIPRHPTVN